MLDYVKKRFAENPFEASLWFITLFIFFLMAVLMVVISLQFQLHQLEGGFREYAVYAVRLLGSALLFSILAALPYFIGFIAAKETNLAWLFLLISLGIIIHHAMLTYNVLFASKSSTAILGLAYYSIFYTFIISLIWAIVAGGRMISRRLNDSEDPD